MLNEDLAGEHAAIVQYLGHAWLIEGPWGPELVGIARDEMRHLKWLGHAIIRLGGLPDLTVATAPDSPPPTGEAMIAADLRAEDDAIRQYEAHRERLEDAGLERMVGRILVDERDHRRQFRELLDRGITAHEPMDGAGTGADPIRTVIRIEYGAVLAALARYFEGVRRSDVDWEERAIEEMKHLGWLGAHLGRHGLAAPFEPKEPADPEAELRAYRRVADSAAADDTAFASLVERIMARERFQEAVGGEESGRRWTVGPLWGPGLGRESGGHG